MSVEAPARARPVRPLVFFAITAAVLHVVVALTNTLFAGVEPSDRDIPGGPAIVGWLHFDSGWYVAIAENGYSWIRGQQSSIAFFPLYPLVLRAVAATGMSTYVAAQVVTVVSGAAVAVVWWTWLGDHVDAAGRRVAFALLLLYPYAWFLYGTGYSDALFLALTMSAFVCADHRRWLAAGVLGGLATATRPVAPAVIVGLVAVALDRSGVVQRVRSEVGTRWRVDRDRWRPGILLVACSAAGLACWCGWLWWRFGDPLAFLTVQSSPGWDQAAGPRTWFKVRFFSLLFGGHLSVLRLAPQALGVLTGLALSPAVARRFGWGYGAYVVAVIGIPAIGTGDFMGTGRYVLAAFPVFALVGEWLSVRRTSWLAPAVLGAAAVGLVVGAGMFGAGNYLT